MPVRITLHREALTRVSIFCCCDLAGFYDVGARVHHLKLWIAQGRIYDQRGSREVRDEAVSSFGVPV
eukprot:CAMPEP_0173372200 /NCGR_PEP_ID=MMETSP1144-20121109/27736_1 /TAXON_ID=483371 /ORGANISM="non described non described, Strain CCMP2298" /LENGTH=66 /DNA_ID=CAMNT_0014324089 /DNA_START=9 /DNA_END=209 /DNA_ORIENTATION=-